MYLKLKHILDVTTIITFSPFILPLMLIISLIIRFKLGKGVVFNQYRGGYKNKPFLMYKFRSMTNEKDINGNLLSDEIRLNSFGKWLRKYSLDELPSFINILKGEMSIVGPRPFVAKYLPFYDEQQKRRHDVLPGLTGWAQVNGRNSISWEKKFEYDVWYVDNINFSLDIKILFLTIFSGVLFKNINEDGHTTASDFLHTPTKQ